MEQIKATCTGCGAHLRVPSDAVGRRARCPRCGVSFRVQPEFEMLALSPATQSDDLFRLAPSMHQSTSRTPEAGYSVRPPNAKQCPTCARTWPTETVICVDCGYDWRTGRTVANEVYELVPERPAHHPAPIPDPWGTAVPNASTVCHAAGARATLHRTLQALRRVIVLVGATAMLLGGTLWLVDRFHPSCRGLPGEIVAIRVPANVQSLRGLHAVSKFEVRFEHGGSERQLASEVTSSSNWGDKITVKTGGGEGTRQAVYIAARVALPSDVTDGRVGRLRIRAELRYPHKILWAREFEELRAGVDYSCRVWIMTTAEQQGLAQRGIAAGVLLAVGSLLTASAYLATRLSS